MDIVGKARKLESRIARTLDDAVQNLVGPSPRQPIEIIHAIVAAAEQQVQHAGRGRRVFPFNRVEVQIAAASKAERARFAALADGPPPLRKRILDRLHAAGCDVPQLEIDLLYPSKAKPSWTNPQFHVDFDRLEAPAAPPIEAAAPAALKLTIAAGAGERTSYLFTGGRIDIGRRSDVVDDRNRLLRLNHVVFKDGEAGPNQTVSRKHAHIVHDAASGEYRLHDDRSAHGTALIRDGQTVPVPAGSRGVRLRDGDEILLGHARLRVKIGARGTEIGERGFGIGERDPGSGNGGKVAGERRK